MADISRLSRLLDGVQRQVNLANNSLVMQSLKLTNNGGSTTVELTVDRLVTLISNVDASSLHNHSSLYYEQLTLGSSSGSSLIGTPSIRAGTNVQDALSGLDSALTTVENDLSNTDSNVANNDAAIQDLQTLSGEAPNATAHADFSGSTIPSAATTRSALQALETAVEDAPATADVVLRDGSQAFTANQSMGSNRLTDLAAPVNDNDAARKIDIDNAAAGIDSKEAVRAATTADITLSGIQTIDGVSLQAGDRVLVKNQTNATENGIYVVDAASWSRSSDFDGSPTSEVRGGALTYVTEGTVSANTSYRLSGTGELAVGTDSLNWVVYSRAEALSAGDGLNKTGLVLSVDASNLAGAGLEEDGSNNLRIATSVAGTGIQLSAGVLSIDFTEFDTDDLVEGSANFFYTEARFDNSFSNKSAVDLSYNGGTSGLAATNVQAAIDEVEARVDTLESQPSSAVAEELTAGETLTSGVRALRFAKGVETTGRVYLADSDASSQDDFWAIGVAAATGETAGQTLQVTKFGTLSAPSHGLAVGQPFYLDNNGAVTSTAPSAADQAVVKLGMVKDGSTLEINIQVMGVN